MIYVSSIPPAGENVIPPSFSNGHHGQRQRENSCAQGTKLPGRYEAPAVCMLPQLLQAFPQYEIFCYISKLKSMFRKGQASPFTPAPQAQSKCPPQLQQ